MNIKEYFSKYESLFSSPEEFEQFLKFTEQPLRKSLRVNTSKISVDEFKELAASNGWELKPIPFSQTGFFIDREDKSYPLGKTLENLIGLFYIQETSSMIPPLVLDPQPGNIILDMAAAPGSKSTQICSLMNNDGLVIANDISIKRTKGLVYNLEQQGSIASAVSLLDGNRFGTIFPNFFDKILLDAPCSGEGTIRKNNVTLNQNIINRISNIQRPLLISAIKSLKLGWEIVYSTCTLAPEENEAIINYILEKYPNTIEVLDWELPGLETGEGITHWQDEQFDPQVKKTKRIWPHLNNSEGFFVAKLRKIGEISSVEKPFKNDNITREQKLNKMDKAFLLSQIGKRFGINKDILRDYHFTIIKNDVWLKNNQYKKVAKFGGKIIQRSGLKIFKWFRKYNGITTNFAQVFGQYATQNIVTINDQETVNRFLKGDNLKLDDNIDLSNATPGIVLIKYKNYFLGKSLYAKAHIKNQLKTKFIF